MRVRGLGVLVLFAAVALAPSALATDYYADLAGGDWQTMIWRLGSNTGTPSGTYPGAAAGDRAIIDFQGISISVTGSIPNPVSLQENNTSCFVTVSSGGNLPLTGSSQVSLGGILVLNGGTVSNAGTLVIASTSAINWSSGTLTGAGTTTVSSGASLNATGSSMTMTSQTLNIAGTMIYGPSASNLQIGAGATLNVQSGGLFDLQTSNNIAGTGTIAVLSGGTFKKTTSSFGANINVTLNNNGLVQVDASSLVLSKGTHTGTFTMNGATTGVTFAFGGTHTFSGANTINGTGEAFFGGTTVINSGATVAVTNMENDGFASFSGAGTINLSGIWTWRGATISGITVNALGGSTVNYTGEGNAGVASSAHLNNQGTFNVNPGAGTLSVTGGGHITNDAQLNIAGDLTVNSDANVLSRIDNLATRVIQKNAGAATAILNVIVNNAGSVSSTSGALKLNKGGLHSGNANFFASTASTTGIGFGGGTHQFTGTPSMNGPGTFAVSAGVLDIDANMTLGPTTPFQQLGGTITGSGAFTLQGTFLWQGGTMDNSSGSGQTVLSLNTTNIVTTSAVTLSGRTLANSGNVNYNPGAGANLAINSGGNFASSGSFIINGDFAINSDQAGGAKFTNSGSVNKGLGAGNFTFNCAFQGTGGTLNVTSGTITFAGGGTDFGNVNFAGPANKVIVGGGNFILNNAPTIVGAGVVVVQGTASLGLNTTVTFDKLEFLGGTISGGTLGIATSLLWQAGTMQGGVTNIGGSATVNATSMTGPLTLSTHSLTNGGTFTWNGAQQLQLTGGSSLINNGTFNATGAGNITAASGADVITNNGTFKKTGGASGTRIDPFFGNSGQLSSEVSGQSLIINGGGSQTGGGSLNTFAGAFIDFFNGTYTVPAGTSPFMGSGIFRVNGGTLAITGNTSIPSPAVLQVTSGVLDVAPSITFQIFAGLQWTGGTLQNGGTTRTFGGSIGNGFAKTLSNNHTLTIAANTFNYTATGTPLDIAGTAALDVESSATLAMANGTTINGTSTDGVTIGGGTLDVSAGLATINSGGSMSFGAINTGTTGALSFNLGTFTISGGSVTGTGAIAVAGATLAVNVNITFPNFNLASGTLGGTGVLTVNGGTWSGGSMTGSGTTSVPAGKSFTIDAGFAKTLARAFSNGGTLTVNQGLTMNGSAPLTNSSQMNIGGSAVTIACGVSCTGGVLNAAGGTLSAVAPSSAIFLVPFNNDGNVTAGGALSFLLGGTHSGDFSAGGQIAFGGITTFSATSDVTGGGGYTFKSTAPGFNNATLAGTYVAGGSVFDPGSVTTFNTTGTAVLGNAFINGDISGTAALLFPTGSTSTWQGGVIDGNTPMTVASGAAMTITSISVSPTLAGRTFMNNGTVTQTRNLGWGATSMPSPTSPSFVNAGSYFVAIPNASTGYLGVPFFNQSTVTVNSGGPFNFQGGYTQTAGTTNLAGGSFSSPLTVNIDGGLVIGNGTITADVSNDGTIAPGASPGLITIAGNYTQSNTGTISAEIGGTAPGTGYDRLAITGNATLAGTLSAVFINGFAPADADVFDLVTWGGTRTGTFTTVNLPAYSFGTLTPSYEPNAFRITTDTVGDLAITKTGPSTAVFGSNVSFTIQVKNIGPSPSNSVTVTDPTPTNLTFVSTSGDCTSTFPCALGTINAGQTKTITATYTVTGGAGTSITNTASVASPSTDNVSTNNTASATVFVELADLAIIKTGPPRAQPGGEITFTITVANGGASAAQNVVVSDPTPAGLTFLGNTGACTTPFPCSLGTIASGSSKTISAKYSISGTLAGSNVTNSASVTTSTTDDPANNTANFTFTVECLNSAPDNLSPTGTAGGSGTLSWRGNGSSYIVYLGPVGSGCSTQFATTNSRSVSYSDLAPGTYEWRVESLDPNCRTFTSACVTFIVPRDCNVPDAPLARVVGQTTSAKTYSVEWDPVPGAVRYEIDEALTADFIGATRLTLTGTSQAYKHDVTLPTAYYYRVRAFVDCMQTPGPSSPTIRVIIIPLPPKDTPRKNVNVPAGSEELIVQEVFIPGEPGQNLAFSATTDRPWLTVRPAAGIITPAGVTLEVVADPKNLPNGTFTASVIVTITNANGGKLTTNGTTTSTVPISVNLVTPVTPISAKPAPSQYALIIPSAGHLDGIGSQWQSDIRVTNAGFKSARYRLTFTPSGGTALGVKQTTITVDAGATTALDDVISNWFGLGTLGDGANGMLEILPIDDPATTALTTVASSRTYNVTGNGTLGQYIPAVPFPSFIGKALPGAQSQVLSLQQIAQNSSYRTNVGLAEAAGLPVNAVVTVFNSGGAKLTEIPVQLAAGEQRQMNQLLAQNGIELADGRLEVKVTGGDGKVTAYASVVDSATQDPLLVSGVPLSGAGSSKYVLAGVANLNTGIANWQTDMRVFNYGATSQPATLTFFPFNNAPSKSVNVLLGAGQVMTLDNLLKSQFGSENTGGAVHLTTLQPASLVVTGRTFNQTAAGTFGQFIPAVKAEEAVGTSGRTLHILQVEDSTRYRTNVGIAEVTGKPATVELQIVLPDSKITPTVQIPLAANEFRQFNPIRELGIGNVYNARITVRVVGGDGRVTAYGSVIDEITQDPTLVPAQ